MSHLRSLIIVLVLPVTLNAFSQNEQDTLKNIELREVEILAPESRNIIERLPSIQGTVINTGKKNEVIKVAKMDADLSTNNARQIFAKVPGVTVWENDGSGIQTGIATRGLSPNRSWEFNVRQNGYDICAEAFGYPEAYYSPPTEALDRIELVRGAASLQYGPQFGGLLNYVMKKGPSDKAVSFETRQTVGSYGLFNSYNAIGGTKGKFNYYAYLHHRNADGWRENSRYNVNTAYASINYAFSKRTSIGAEYTRMNYQSQQPGGLTDSSFAIDPQRSTRARNWFSAPWNVAALNFDHAFNEDLKINAKVFTTMAQRNSVGFLRPINVNDSFDPELASQANRQVDRDAYMNMGAEVRMLRGYSFLGKKSHLSVGMRTYKGTTTRKQQGVGSTGDDLDISISDKFGKAFTLNTIDHAVFIENQFQLTKRFSIVPGIRYEAIASTVEGRINTSENGALEALRQERNLILYGVGSEYIVSKSSNIYANYSQAYRPVLYSDLIPSATTDVIDPQLKDASGYNVDLGYRGTVNDYLSFDVGAFYLYYDDRIGTISVDGVPFRTNIGSSVSKGIESFVEWDPVRMFTERSKVGHIKLFLSYANVDARYTRWDDPELADNEELSWVGNRVENAPEVIARYGATYALRNFSLTFQRSEVASIFTDANNSEEPNAAGTIGKLKGYQVMDISASWIAKNGFELRGGVNNLADVMYATRRAGGYPGPGIMPANGRTVWFSVDARF